VFNVVHNYVDFIHVAANNYFLTEENIFASYDHGTIIIYKLYAKHSSHHT